MKILIVDQKPHDELKEALKEHNITLEHEPMISNDTDLSSYILVILCPPTESDLKKLFAVNSFEKEHVIVFYTQIDFRFINFCNELGCIDVIKTPYKPTNTANRLLSFIEALPTKEVCISPDANNNSLIFSVDEYLKMEIQRSNRGKTQLSFLAIKLLTNISELSDVSAIIKKLLRDTDFIMPHMGYILIVLPYCDKNSVHFLKARLKDCLSPYHPDFFSITKTSFYDKPMANEKEILLEILDDGLNQVNKLEKIFK